MFFNESMNDIMNVYQDNDMTLIVIHFLWYMNIVIFTYWQLKNLLPLVQYNILYSIYYHLPYQVGVIQAAKKGRPWRPKRTSIYLAFTTWIGWWALCAPKALNTWRWRRTSRLEILTALWMVRICVCVYIYIYMYIYIYIHMDIHI